MSNPTEKIASYILHREGYGKNLGLLEQVAYAIEDNRKWDKQLGAVCFRLGIPAWEDPAKAIQDLKNKNASLEAHIEKMDASHREEIERLSEDRAIREANKALNNEPKKAMKYLMIPLNLASALVAVVVEWSKGGSHE